MNTTSTRVEVRWNVASSAAISEEERERILDRLSTRIAKAGVLRVVAGARRSQAQNRETAIARLEALVAEALHVPKPRRATRPPKSVTEARLRDKHQRARRKQERRPPKDDE